MKRQNLEMTWHFIQFRQKGGVATPHHHICRRSSSLFYFSDGPLQVGADLRVRPLLGQPRCFPQSYPRRLIVHNPQVVIGVLAGGACACIRARDNGIGQVPRGDLAQ